MSGVGELSTLDPSRSRSQGMRLFFSFRASGPTLVWPRRPGPYQELKKRSTRLGRTRTARPRRRQCPLRKRRNISPNAIGLRGMSAWSLNAVKGWVAWRDLVGSACSMNVGSRLFSIAAVSSRVSRIRSSNRRTGKSPASPERGARERSISSGRAEKNRMTTTDQTVNS
jgi:hypothetical protein